MSTTSDVPKAKTCKDIFISYSRRDKAWVDGYLRRLLEAADVPFVIDEDDFQIGVPLDQSIRKLINECPFTLLVMTPDWVNGKWTHFEAELASQQTAEHGGERVLLPLMLRPCVVPAKIVSCLYLDLSQARKRDQEIVKLLHRLGVSDERIADAKISVAKKPLLFLIELLTEPTASDQISEVDKKLDQIRRSNDILTATKRLHDQLQDIEFPLRQLIEFLDDASRAAGEPDWKRIRVANSALSEKLNNLIDFSARVQTKGVDVNFVKPFKAHIETIDQAFRSREADKFSRYVHAVSVLVGRALPRVNDRVVQLVKERRLCDLVEKLQSIYELAADIEFDSDVIEILLQFRSTIEELVELEKVIHEEVDDHGTFQNAESNLHLCNPDAEPTIKDIQENWDFVHAFIGDLRMITRYSNLLRQSNELSMQLRDDKIVRDDDFEMSVKDRFSDFVHEMRKSFNKLDIDLLADCDKLKPRSDGLSDLFKRMKPNVVHD